MKTTTREKRAVNMLSLIFLGIGGFFIAASLLHYTYLNASNFPSSTTGIWDSFFFKRCLLGGVFILCGTILHLLLKRETQESNDDPITDGDFDSSEALRDQP